MKKLIFSFLVGLIALPIVAEETFPGSTFPGETFPEQAQFEQAFNDAANRGQQQLSYQDATLNAYKNSVYRITIKTSAKLEGAYQEPKIHTYQCLAVRISPDYLVASTACISPLMTGSADRGGGSNPHKDRGLPLADKQILSVNVGQETIANIQWQGFDRDTSHLIFIAKPLGQEELSAPIPLIFVPKSPANMASWFDTFWVNTLRSALQVGKFNGPSVSRFSFDSKFRPVDGVFKGDKALTGAPVFAVRDNIVFLIGFNNAETVDFYPESGKKYYYFTDAAKYFLEQKANKNNIKSEGFFLQ